MGALASVALPGLGSFAIAFEGFGDDEPEDTASETPETPYSPVDPEAPEIFVEGVTLTQDGDETVTGAEGADTLTAVACSLEEQALFDETQQIDLLGVMMS